MKTNSFEINNKNNVVVVVYFSFFLRKRKGYCYMKWWWFLSYFVILCATKEDLPDCPSWMSSNGFIHELGILADAVSWDHSDNVIWGVCGNYLLTHDIQGKYDTRMRIYQSQSYNFSVISFRPTQSTPEGQNIHYNRQMTECSFVPECQGKVHDRFQEAFLSLVEQIDDWSFLRFQVATIGHSLGGSLQLFMALYLWKVVHKPPLLSLGFAGPFIGDELFSHTFLLPYHQLMNGLWWQIETIDQDNPYNYDGTVENYQVGSNELFVWTDAICLFPIHPLPVPKEAYGMHDLKQYQLFMAGKEC